MLDHSIVGVRSEPVDISWTSTDSLLYAISVGAGLGDPSKDLEFTTENSEGLTQRALPTMAVVIAQREPVRVRRKVGDFDAAQLVHAEQGFELFSELTASGTVRVSSMVAGIYDKRSGALVRVESEGVDIVTGKRLFVERSAVFIRGEGGFGGDPGESAPWSRPDRQPDVTVRYRTREEQALLYRLTGDRNPLHSDPSFAARGGFTRPILHGLCTYGFTSRALSHGRGDGKVARMRSMHGRFTAPVFPGDDIVVSMWDDGEQVLFQTATGDGTVVIDRGAAQLG